LILCIIDLAIVALQKKPWGSVAPKMTTARAFISSWVVPQLSSGSKRNNLGFGKLGFMRRASPCPYPRATLARSIVTWWRSPAGRFNCSPQSLRLDIIMGALSNGYKVLSEFFAYYHFPLLRILCDFCNLTDLVRDVGSFFKMDVVVRSLMPAAISVCVKICFPVNALWLDFPQCRHNGDLA
jgi:hypothetical protein